VAGLVTRLWGSDPEGLLLDGEPALMELGGNCALATERPPSKAAMAAALVNILM
jgi:hypothetical protein